MNITKPNINSAATAPLFFFGTLISSVGSFAFNVSLIAFMLQSGFHLGEASVIIALQRFLPVLVNAAWGHLTDEFSPCLTISIAEGIAALTSVALILIWKNGDTNYLSLVFLCVIRSIVVSFQAGSRSKITKHFSDHTYLSNSRNSIWLNKATQGATLFGGLAGWILIHYFSFKVAVIFDAVTFFINGIIAFIIPNFQNLSEDFSKIRMTWHQKFKDLYSYNNRSAKLDILLLIPAMGTVAYMARLAGDNQSWIGIFMAGYGLAVWTSGYLERGITSKISAAPFWIIFSLCFLVLGQFKGPGLLPLLILFIKDLSFWVIFHRISSHMQMDTPAPRIGSVMSARNCVMTAILTSGEVLVGMWSNVISVSTESWFRGLFGLCVGLIIYFTELKKYAVHDRPLL